MRPASVHDRRAQRVQAVLDLFRGAPVAEVSKRHQIGRSDLYKFRRRALTAMEEALAARRRGPRRAPNRVAFEREAQVVALCKRHPTLSSYAVGRETGTNRGQTGERGFGPWLLLSRAVEGTAWRSRSKSA
jgi:transposase